jgi:KUP system potassium uptake protein
VLSDESAAESPFFSLVEGEGLTFALVLLSSAATVIASQALISGAYSLTRQAIQLGYMPRVSVKHTASEAEGQIYVPGVNWVLMIACVVLVVSFGKSTKLAGAYGIAVTGTMAVTSVVYYVVLRRTWRWHLLLAAPIALLFLCFDVPFFLANVAKILDGGYVPIAMAAVMVIVMLVWSRGRRLMYEMLAEKAPPVEELPSVCASIVARAPGTAVFLASDPSKLPPSLVRHVRMNHVLHEKVVLVAVKFDAVPMVAEKARFEVRKVSDELWVIKLHFGFMEIPSVIGPLGTACAANDVPYDPKDATYYLGRETILAGPGGKMDRITETLFAFLQRNALAADSHFGLPPSQVVEIGSQVDL